MKASDLILGRLTPPMSHGVFHSFFRGVMFLFALLTAFSITPPGWAQVTDRVTGDVDPAKVQVLPNHLPAWANAANQASPVPANQTLDQMTMVLQRSPGQEQAFEKLLADQQNPASPDYHRWLTPAEVGDRFGLSLRDIASISGWLRSQGLHVNWVSPSRMFIGFGGTAADLGRAFQTELHYYNVNGERLMSVSSAPMIPEALAPAIKAIRGLSTIQERPAHRARAIPSDSPEVTNGSNHFMAPADFATIYDLPSSLTGAGMTIGIVGESRTDSADFSNFTAKTGSAAIVGRLTEYVPAGLGGVDPGPAYTSPPSGGASTGNQGEATLDVIRTGTVAPAANLLLVVATATSGGIGVDAQYLVDTNPVPAQVMSISFGACESAAGASGVDFWDTLFKSAAAEGISVFVSSGDSGASGCDFNFSPPPSNPAANSPNYICSSSYATCVGGTEFNDTTNASTYWSSANNAATLGSALSYIPEGGWNEATTSSVAASGGGVSTVIPTPSWQTGTGVPTARSGRYTPDLSFSAAGHDGYLGCFAAGGASCVPDSNGTYYFTAFSGTSASAPGMAGVAALLDQKMGAAQGNLNPGIYATAASAPLAFHDVTVSTSGVSNCSVNTPSMCNNSIPSPTSQTGGQAGFLVTNGYDLVTGLGSLDVAAFINDFSGELAPTVHVSLSSANITTTQSLTVTVSVSGGSGNPTPTGSVKLTGGSYSSASATLSNGGATIVIPAGSLPAGIGDLTLTVTYTPDAASSSTYTSATGSNTVTVSFINPSVSVTLSSSSITTAQALTVTIAVSGGAGNPTPTGAINFTGGGYSLWPATLTNGSVTLNLAAGLLAPGNDSLDATYIPDTQSSPIYSSAVGSNTVTVTATAKFTPTLTVTPSASTAAVAEPFPVKITASGGAGNPTPTGSITLITGSYSSGGVALSGGSAAITIPAGSLTTGSDTLTAIYAPDSASSPTYNNTSGSASVSVLNPVKSVPAVWVNPSASSITTAQQLTVTISVSGTNGYPTTTGSVTLSGGGYTSAATTLSNNSATIVIPAKSLAVGSDTLTASYTPDSASSAIFFSATGTNTVTITVPKTTPTVSVSPSSSSITSQQVLSVTIAVSGGSGQPTPTGSVILTSGYYSSASTALNNGGATFNIAAGSLAAGTDTLTVTYTPDAASSSTYSSATGSSQVTVTIPPPAGFTITGTAVSVNPGATSGNTSTITVTPSGGFTGNVTLTAAVTSSPAGAVDPPTFNFGSTSPVSIGTSAGTATLTVLTTAATTGSLAFPARPGIPWLPAGGAVLAGILLIGVPARRRWRTMLGLVLLLVAVAGAVSACGGISNSGSTKLPLTITPTVTVTPTPSSITTAQALSVAVTVSGGAGNATPTGTVTVFSGTYSSPATALSGGSATVNVSAGSLAKGTDTLTVSYTPDSASSSTYSGTTGSASVVVTAANNSGTTAGSYTVTVTGTSGSITQTGTFTLTVQ